MLFAVRYTLLLLGLQPQLKFILEQVRQRSVEDQLDGGGHTGPFLQLQRDDLCSGGRDRARAAIACSHSLHLETQELFRRFSDGLQPHRESFTVLGKQYWIALCHWYADINARLTRRVRPLGEGVCFFHSAVLTHT